MREQKKLKNQTYHQQRPSTDLTATPTDTGPPAKRGRKAGPEPTPPKSAIKQTPRARAQKAPNESNSTSTPTGASRSSFGRVRSTPNKSGYVYGDDMNDSTEPIDVEPTPPPPSAATKKGQQPPKAEPVVEEEVVEVEPEDEYMEEAFLTFGPYQCEIGHTKLDTKVELVEHVEGKHFDDSAVDQTVLCKLKSDIRKSKKKNAASEAPPPPPPKKAAPTPPPKKAAQTPPPKVEEVYDEKKSSPSRESTTLQMFCM